MEWKISDTPVAYEDSLSFMEERVAAIHAGTAEECIWLLEHPPLYTSGTSAKSVDLLDSKKFPVYEAGRGGEYTYHGPGQRIAYVMLDLRKLFSPEAPDLRAYIKRLEGWIITTLAQLGVEGFTREGRIGVWVRQKSETGEDSVTIRHPASDFREAKIAAIGVRVRKWVSFHGIALNVNPNLEHYQGIVPCGIREHGVTSLEAMGIKASMEQLDTLLCKIFETEFLRRA